MTARSSRSAGGKHGGSALRPREFPRPRSAPAGRGTLRLLRRLPVPQLPRAERQRGLRGHAARTSGDRRRPGRPGPCRHRRTAASRCRSKPLSSWPAALAAAIRHLADQPDERARLSAGAREPGTRTGLMAGQDRLAARTLSLNPARAEQQPNGAPDGTANKRRPASSP